MIFTKKISAWAVLYVILLTSFTLYVALDTFVITRVYEVIPSDEFGGTLSFSETDFTSDIDVENPETFINQDNESQTDSQADSEGESLDETFETITERDDASQFSESAVITENSYSDQNISITITQYREYDTAIYVADVYVSSVEYLQTAFAQNAFGKNITETTSAIAAANNAILAINGDYYGSQTKCYVLKNGALYRETASRNQEDLVIWEDGSFEIITEGEVSAQALLENGALQVLSFGPALVLDGSVSVSESEEVGKAKASNPRTAIGIVDDLHYLFVVSDGRTGESEGLTLYQLAEFMQGLGSDIAYNLDGGGSSTMVWDGEVINNPTSSGKSIKERSVSDIVYIGY